MVLGMSTVHAVESTMAPPATIVSSTKSLQVIHEDQQPQLNGFVAPSVSPFVDVSTTQLFYKEMAWLASQGISTGWVEGNGARTYRPLTPVNRDAMAAFMYRLSGSPEFVAPSVSPFVDVSTTQLFYKEMAWLASQGISTGWVEGNGARTYRPLTPVNRDAMAAFMYRLDPKL
ncbi:S-layer homology domain-containing protein, partial [Arthrobacter sp. Bz4]|uniref:S-layer homology domain-containing protein n=1 Tax=Arthrobacter sp. Bz4 TaxID=2171979 RepID=UPI000D506B54